jgi:hypothetical protein
VDLEVVFLHHQTRPNHIEQLLFGDQFTGMVHQYTQNIKSPGPDHHGLAVAEQPALMPLKNKITKGTDSGV